MYVGIGWCNTVLGTELPPVCLSPIRKNLCSSHVPQKDERGRVKLDVNNLLSIGALSWTLDRDPRSESSPQVFHHSGQRQLVNTIVPSKGKRKGPLPWQQGDRPFFGRHCWKEGERYLLGHNTFRSKIETQMLKLKLNG